MIEIIFLGVGEAFDERLSNTSVLIRYVNGMSSATVLLDCGFTAPPQFWKQELDVDELDGIWISHFHGDHSFGLPALLVRFWEEGRKKVLTLLGQKGIEFFTRKSLDLAYSGFFEKMGFPLRFIEVEPNKEIEIFGLSLQSAENSHAQRDLALKIGAQGKSIYYSGDGKHTTECMELARGSQLIIHEAFHMDGEMPGHGTVKGAIDMAKQCEAQTLAIVHIQRDIREQVKDRIRQIMDSGELLKIMVPEPGYRITL